MPNTIQLRNAFESERSCRYQDFYINGRRLADQFENVGRVPPLGWLIDEADLHSRRLLFLEEDFESDSERVPLYVCNFGGDYLCGYLAASVTREDDRIIWSNFAEANCDYSNPDGSLEIKYEQHETLSRLRFAFDAEQYRNAILEGTPTA